MPIRKTIPADRIEEAIKAIASQIAKQHAATSSLAVAAIANGGIPVAELLRSRLASEHALETHAAIVDISFHRDDIGDKPIAKEVEATHFLHAPEDTAIILVDDVLCSGRSVRAALAEIHSMGRPRKIELAVLVDRGNRRLPIQADYVGLRVETSPDEDVVVRLNLDEADKSHIDIVTT